MTERDPVAALPANLRMQLLALQVGGQLDSDEARQVAAAVLQHVQKPPEPPKPSSGNRNAPPLVQQRGI
ncbi:hypothetical protein JHW45_07930 [Paracoccus stylophorae]|uniref:Uncharacterized protein n=1 Tax=Paracoccus stylophorae TaxID=659350 RepID=A0ABY7SYY9_9RHOB|nr:hypothetical protein [Paracoccus stylophorae]WCR12239.1 hypothetical protein JHW45_07930 [Paracoccus stylophorae]